MSSKDPAIPPAFLHKRSIFPRSVSELIASQFVPGSMADTRALHTNMGVDYVLVFRTSSPDQSEVTAQFERLVQKLSSVGLATAVRPGKNNTLLVFVKVASDEHVSAEIYRSRVKDWIHGVRMAAPAREVQKSLEDDPMTEAERLRTIYQLLTNPEIEGGAGLRPKSKEWSCVESVFALHDHTFNKHWIRKWSTEYQIKSEDLDEIRNRFGEKVAFYFAFEQAYFTFLLAPSALGLLAWLVLGSFSPFYAIFASLWSIVFVEWWKHQERDLAIRWGVHGVSAIESRRPDFKPTKEVQDSATGELQSVFPTSERLKRQLWQIPFAIAAVLVLGSLIVLCFAIEIFIGDIYDGPGKSILTFTPTVILTTCLPLLTGVLTNLAERLNKHENYETEWQYTRQLTGKLFVLDFVTSYLGIMLTAFVYVPFGAVLAPYLDIFANIFDQTSDKIETKGHYTINPDRLRKQTIYFAVTAQIVNFAMEVGLPYLQRQGFLKFQEIRAKRAPSGSLQTPASVDDEAEEKEFLDRVRNEAELPAYDVYTDLREMVIQFGYLSLFSVVWPLMPVSYLINNWFELRADAVKICVEMQRPTPWRADTIGLWLDALSFLAWLGSLTMAALTYLFSNEGIGPDGRPHEIKGWALLLSIFFSEHVYLFVRGAVATAISHLDSPGLQKERKARHLRRQKLFEDCLAELPRAANPVADEAPVTRESLEEDARRGSLRTTSNEARFWSRQKGWRESAEVGKNLIEAHQRVEPESKKEL